MEQNKNKDFLNAGQSEEYLILIFKNLTKLKEHYNTTLNYIDEEGS